MLRPYQLFSGASGEDAEDVDVTKVLVDIIRCLSETDRLNRGGLHHTYSMTLQKKRITG